MSPFRGLFLFMDIVEKQLREVAEETAKLLNFILLDVSLFRKRKGNLVVFVIDDDDGIDLQDCANFSRALITEIEKRNLLDNYRVEVSSPGVDRPLKYLRQYPKHINREFELKYTDGEIEKNVIGKLIQINNDKLSFLIKDQIVTIEFDRIKKAKVKVSF